MSDEAKALVEAATKLLDSLYEGGFGDEMSYDIAASYELRKALEDLKSQTMSNLIAYDIKVAAKQFTYRVALQERQRTDSSSVWYVEAAKTNRQTLEVQTRCFILNDSDAALLLCKLSFNLIIVIVEQLLAMTEFDKDGVG